MEDLTKQQIILLTLLVSFVTSLATGIVTVSLMDQNTFGITQVINRVVERTVEPPVSQPATVIVPTLTRAAAQVNRSVVQLKQINGKIQGIGLVLSPEGLIVADKAALDGKDLVAVLPNNREVTVQMIQSEILGDIAFAAALLPEGVKLTPVTSPSNLSSIKLGDNVYALSGEILEEGIMKKAPDPDEKTLETSISSPEILVGSPLFTIEGKVLGFKTTSLQGSTSFHSLAALKSITPQLSR